MTEVTEIFSGNGAEDTFPLSYDFVTRPGSVGDIYGVGYVTYNGINESFDQPGQGATWEYISASNSIQRVSGAPASGVNNISITYYEDSATALPSATYTYTVPLVVGLDILRNPEIRVHQEAGAGLNTLSCRVQTTQPPGGTHVHLQDPASLTNIFNGIVVRTTQVPFEGHLFWDVETVDYAWLFNRRRPFGIWTNENAKNIAFQLFQSYITGFNFNYVSPSLPAISISFDGSMTMSEAFAAIADACGNGCIFFLDDFDIHLGPPTDAEPTIYEVTERLSGNGSATVFALAHAFVVTPGSGAYGLGYVTYDAGSGPVNETFGVDGGGTTWEYIVASNSIERTAGAPVAGVENIVITYSAETPLATVDDNDLYLLREPPPRLTKDWTQVRNRVNVRGVGSPLRTEIPTASLSIPVEDASPFTPGCTIRIGVDVRVVDTVYNGSYTGADPSLTMVTLTSATSRAYNAGTMVNLWIVLNDTTEQGVLAAVEGGDGIHESPLYIDGWTIGDDVVDTTGDPHNRADAEIVSLTLLGNNELDTWAAPTSSLEYATRDVNTKPGLYVVWNLTNPPIVGTFKIQEVDVDQINIDGEVVPRLQVKAAPWRFNMNDFMRQASGGGGGSVQVSGGSGGGGGASLAPMYRNEVPAGAVNGSNVVYTTAFAYRPGSLVVYVNGVKQNLTTHFTETTSTTFTMTTAPWSGSNITVDYLGY